MKEYFKQLFDFRRLFRPSSIKMINITILLSITFTGLVQFYLREAPIVRSLYPSIGAAIVLVIYLRYVTLQERKHKKKYKKK